MTLTESALFQPGHVVDGKYKIIRVIGRGGMGVVYEAHHLLLAQSVALKVVLPEIAGHPEIVARFMSEARNSAKIESDHVARVMDVGKLENGIPFMVMELLTGQDLDAILTSEGALDATRVVDLMLETLDGVASAHALGIIHRDLKPGNLFVSRKGSRLTRVKVLDFGISKNLGAAQFAGSHVTSTSSIVGSPAYMSPEQLRGSKQIDARADIWSLGVIAYQLVTGVLPYESDNVGALFAAILETEPLRPRQLKPDMPEALDIAIMKCLQKKPADRFKTTLELAAALTPMGTKIAERALERIQSLVLMTPTAQFMPTSSSPAIDASSTPPIREPAALASTHISDVHLEALAPNPPSTQGSWASQPVKPSAFKKSGVLLLLGGIALIAIAAVIVSTRTSGFHAAPKDLAMTGSAASSLTTAVLADPPATAAIATTAPPAASRSAPQILANAAASSSASTSTAPTLHSRKNTKPAASGKGATAPDDLFGRF